MDIELNFTSTAAAITQVELALVYLDNSGTEREIPIPYSIPSSSTTLRDNVSWTIPNNLPVLGYMTVRAHVHNSVFDRYFETHVRIVSEMMISMKLLPCNYNPAVTQPPFPILMTAAHISQRIKSWKLWVKKPNEEDATAVNLTVLPTNPGGEEITYASQVYNYTPQGGLRQGTYVFQLEAELANEEKTRSETVTMDVLKVNYQPIPQDVINEAHANGEASDLNGYPWPRMMIEDLNFAAGDFIETDMDLTNCVFIDRGDNSRSIGLDNIISIGLNGINWDPWAFNVYYPRVATGSSYVDWLYLAPLWSGGGYSGVPYQRLTNTAPQHFRLDKDGFFWNNQRIDYAAWPVESQASVASVHAKLISANKLYLGSTEGSHRSRAKYRFVRVVYNGRNSSTREGMDDFNGNPQNGGNL